MTDASSRESSSLSLVARFDTVVESGRHEELLRKGGRYASFYRLQLKGQEQMPQPRGLTVAASDA